jgi:predicted ATP-grasp superfamily ATP-dependent carboligase
VLGQIGDALADAFDLNGLFGVDGIASGERFWPIEINPRYVASIEILERASGASFLQFHAAACQQGILPPSPPVFSTLHGKAILYAPRDASFTQPAADWVAQANTTTHLPVVADIPHFGEPLPAGSPIATLLATGDTLEAVTHQLQTRCEQLRTALRLPPTVA